jgi:hypothetical protein
MKHGGRQVHAVWLPGVGSAARGLRPCDPRKTKPKPFYEEKRESSSPSRWSGPRVFAVERDCGKDLLKLATKGRTNS